MWVISGLLSEEEGEEPSTGGGSGLACWGLAGLLGSAAWEPLAGLAAQQRSSRIHTCSNLLCCITAFSSAAAGGVCVSAARSGRLQLVMHRPGRARSALVQSEAHRAGTGTQKFHLTHVNTARDLSDQLRPAWLQAKASISLPKPPEGISTACGLP